MIEFQYFNGCPNSDITLKNLKALITDGFIDEKHIKIVEVPDVDSSERLNFQGSPTILVHGQDIYTGKEPDSSNYSCRVYTIDGTQTGVLSKEYIKQKIKKIRG